MAEGIGVGSPKREDPGGRKPGGPGGREGVEARLVLNLTSPSQACRTLESGARNRLSFSPQAVRDAASLLSSRLPAPSSQLLFYSLNAS